MKKNVLIALLMLTAFCAKAQVTVKPGIRAGANFASFTGGNFDTKTDFYLGTFAAVKLTRFYTLQPEVTYSRQGAEATLYYNDYNTGSYVYDKADIDMQYLSLALINKFTLTNSVNLHVGPTLDFIVNRSPFADTDADVGITAGAGYTFPFGLTIEARVKKGFVSVLNDYDYSYEGYDSYEYGSMTNIVYTLGVSYSFKVTGATK